MILLHWQLYCVIYNNLFVNHEKKLWIENKFIFWPNSEGGCKKQKEQSEETHYMRASVAASLLDAHFLFLSSPTHTLFLWRPLKSPTRLRGCPLPHSSALLRFTRCSHPRSSSSPSSQWFVRAEVPHALGSELEEGSTPCLVAWMYYLFDFLNKKFRLSKVRAFVV